MPKVKDAKNSKSQRHNPLAEEIIEAQDNANIRRVPRKKLGQQSKNSVDEEAVPARVTQKVLEIAQLQKVADDSLGAGGLELDDDIVVEEEEEIMSDVEVDEDGFVMGLHGGTTEEEEKALALFMPGAGAPKTQTLADVILQKIQEHEARGGKPAEAAGGAATQEEGISPKVIQVYGEIGKWLSHYKSGKLPKAFKVIPSLTNWEEVLSLTNPIGWSPAGMYEAVAIFASNLNPRMAQRFYNLVLLPAVRQNIARYGKLNFHYYRSMRKALFKPAAFFKGICLPLAVESCTLREASILASVLGKASVPPMHCAATLMRLAEMTPWYGTTAIILAALINKKYALPVRVVESLVAHFCAFGMKTNKSDDDVLPLVWHRCLLIFVQRYKFDLNEDQRRRIMSLLKVHFHEAVGPEVRRELLAPKPGEAPAPGTKGTTAMDLS